VGTKLRVVPQADVAAQNERYSDTIARSTRLRPSCPHAEQRFASYGLSDWNRPSGDCMNPASGPVASD